MSTTTSTFTTTTCSTTTTTLTTTTSFTTTSTSSTSSTTHSTSTTTTTAPNIGFCLFRNVTIPHDSRIVKAVVEFTGYAPSSGVDTNAQCYFEDADNPSAPSDKNDLETRILTSGIPWKNIEEWKDNYDYQTPQLRDILQEVIDRDGWVSGNSILFTIKNDESDSYRLWSAIEHRGGLERARLKVSWAAPKKLDPPIIEPVETFRLTSFNCSIRAFPTDANIYYTVDGSNPNDNDILYSGPFVITDSTEIRARAYKEYWTYSDIASRNYSFYTDTAMDIFDITPDGFDFGMDRTHGQIVWMKWGTDGNLHILASAVDPNPEWTSDERIIYLKGTPETGFTHEVAWSWSSHYQPIRRIYGINGSLDSNNKLHFTFRWEYYYGGYWSTLGRQYVSNSPGYWFAENHRYAWIDRPGNKDVDQWYNPSDGYVYGHPTEGLWYRRLAAPGNSWAIYVDYSFPLYVGATHDRVDSSGRWHCGFYCTSANSGYEQYEQKHIYSTWVKGGSFTYETIPYIATPPPSGGPNHADIGFNNNNEAVFHSGIDFISDLKPDNKWRVVSPQWRDGGTWKTFFDSVYVDIGDMGYYNYQSYPHMVFPKTPKADGEMIMGYMVPAELLSGDYNQEVKMVRGYYGQSAGVHTLFDNTMWGFKDANDIHSQHSIWYDIDVRPSNSLIYMATIKPISDGGAGHLLVMREKV